MRPTLPLFTRIDRAVLLKRKLPSALAPPHGTRRAFCLSNLRGKAAWQPLNAGKGAAGGTLNPPPPPGRGGGRQGPQADGPDPGMPRTGPTAQLEGSVKKFDPYKIGGIPRELFRLIVIASTTLVAAYLYMRLKPAEITEADKRNNLHFFARLNAIKSVKATFSGLMFRVINEAETERPPPDQVKSTVLIHYECRLPNGKLFDSSYNNDPCEFDIKLLLDGLAQGISMMKPGSEYEFFIPYHLAYQEHGSRIVPPFSPLIVKVKLVDYWDTPKQQNFYIRSAMSFN